MAHLLPIRQAEDKTKKIEAKALLLQAEVQKINAENNTNNATDEQEPSADNQSASQTTTTNKFNDKRDNLPRPKIEENSSESDWDFFKAQWKQYVQGTNMSSSQEIQHLWAACSETLQYNLHNGGGNRILDPQILLEHIRLLAVQRKNNLVNIVELQHMGQGQQESIMQFSTRLNGQADLCDLVVECTDCGQSVSFKEKTIMHQFVRGLSDQHAQERILEAAAAVKGGQLSLTKVLKIAEAHEKGKTSQTQVNNELNFPGYLNIRIRNATGKSHVPKVKRTNQVQENIKAIAGEKTILRKSMTIENTAQHSINHALNEIPTVILPTYAVEAQGQLAMTALKAKTRPLQLMKLKLTRKQLMIKLILVHFPEAGC